MENETQPGADPKEPGSETPKETETQPQSEGQTEAFDPEQWVKKDDFLGVVNERKELREKIKAIKGEKETLDQTIAELNAAKAELEGKVGELADGLALTRFKHEAARKVGGDGETTELLLDGLLARGFDWKAEGAMEEAMKAIHSAMPKTANVETPQPENSNWEAYDSLDGIDPADYGRIPREKFRQLYQNTSFRK